MKYFLFPLIFFLTACGSNLNKQSVGTRVTDSYAVPATYWDHRAQQQFFETSEGRLAYTDHGEGDVLVLLHGVPTSSWMYRKIIPGLQANHRIITIDFLGFGSSDKPDDDISVYDIHHRANRVTALLNSLGIKTYSLLIHDMGGLVAWDLLRSDPSQIDNLIVLNTIIHDKGFNQPTIEPGFFTSQMMKAYSSNLTSAAILDKTFSDLGLTGDYKLSETECFGYVAPIREGSDRALYAFFTQVNDELMQQLDRNLTAFQNYTGKTLIFWGEKDETLTKDQVSLLQTALKVPDENIHLYADNAHFLAEEIPDDLVTIITSFLAE